MSEDSKPADVFHKVYQEFSGEEKELMEELKEKASELYSLFSRINKSFETRETSLAKTKLEEAVMWALKAITK